jgi:FkbM family methyltransferase
MQPITGRGGAARAWLRYAPAVVDAWKGETIRVARTPVLVPGPRAIRLSVVAGNIRLHRLFDAVLRPGATVVDIGANIGYNAVYAATRVGASGRVIAIEPAADNLAVLEQNIAATGLRNVTVRRAAAGRDSGTRDFFLRGNTSAVNSFFPESCYAAVTGVVQVPVAPADDLVDGDADLVKIDVEGAELDVLAGMSRLLRHPRITLIVEWHPALQTAAGYALDALPRWLLDRGFQLRAASHMSVRSLVEPDLPALAARLHGARRPVELVAHRL